MAGGALGAVLVFRAAAEPFPLAAGRFSAGAGGGGGGGALPKPFGSGGGGGGGGGGLPELDMIGFNGGAGGGTELFLCVEWSWWGV